MTALRLMPPGGTCTYHKIMTGRKWIGRVIRHAEGGYLGIIGKLTVRAETSVEAFEEVGARWMGYESAAALRSKNRMVRRARAVSREIGNYAMGEIERGNFEPLTKLLETPAGGAIAVNAFGRLLRK